MLQYPSNLNNLAIENGGTMMRFTLFKRPNSQESNLDEMIYLYMPETLQNNTNTVWEQNDVGNAARQMVGKNIGDADLVGLGADKAIRSISKFVKNAAGENRTEFATQRVINPYIAMTFKGINFRQFELTFKFTPHALDESKTIQEIISKFREASLPSINKGNTAHIGYPMEIDVAYVGAGAEWLFKYKRCVLTAVDVNYAGAGFYAAMENGFPAQTEMTLRFSENELISSEDVKFGGEGY